MTRLRLTLAAGLVSLFTGPASGGICDTSPMLSGRMLTDVCWDCVFPIKVAGIPLGGDGHVPLRSAAAGICTCPGPDGIPRPGVTISMWEPARLVEIVRQPGCSPMLGTRLPMTNPLAIGTDGHGEEDASDVAFYHYHFWTFPLFQVLDLFVVDNCVQDGFVGIDLAYPSELDPTWTTSTIAFYAHPETALVANDIAQSACIGDAVAANLGEGIDALFWCGGSWGSLYPITGNAVGPTSNVRVSSLLSMRALAAMHRRGLAWRTMGDDTLCQGVIDPMLPKSQYQLSWLMPIPERHGKHALGELTMNWGEWRQIPGTDDQMHLVWRWNDCCSSRR